jgi:hypothetical protein
MTMKATDTGKVGARSAHGAKKSSGVAGRTGFAERSVSRRRPPGEGMTARSLKLPTPEGGSSTSRRRTLPPEAAVGYRKETRRKAVATEPAAAYRREERPKRPRNEAPQRRKAESARGSPVQGRKKAPSEMNVSRHGGPRKRMPLHEG